MLLLLTIFISACTTPQVSPARPPTITSDQAAVNIENFAFNPAVLTIKKGTTVTWTNMDSAPHTVNSDTQWELDSGSLSKGQSFSHTFNEAGTFDYHCAFHSMMTAKVIVE